MIKNVPNDFGIFLHSRSLFRNAEEYQAKIRTAMIEGKIADEDFNGDPEYNVLGQSGIRPRAPRAPKAKPGEEGEQPEQGKVNPVRYICRGPFD